MPRRRHRISVVERSSLLVAGPAPRTLPEPLFVWLELQQQGTQCSFVAQSTRAFFTHVILHPVSTAKGGQSNSQVHLPGAWAECLWMHSQFPGRKLISSDTGNWVPCQQWPKFLCKQKQRKLNQWNYTNKWCLMSQIQITQYATKCHAWKPNTLQEENLVRPVNCIPTEVDLIKNRHEHWLTVMWPQLGHIQNTAYWPSAPTRSGHGTLAKAQALDGRITWSRFLLGVPMIFLFLSYIVDFKAVRLEVGVQSPMSFKRHIIYVRTRMKY